MPQLVDSTIARAGVAPFAPVSGFIGNDDLKEIRDICFELIAHFKSTSEPSGGHDATLYELCCREATSRGYSLEDPSIALFFTTCLPGGITMASLAYGHLENPSRRVYIALYTAFLFYLDDTFASNVAGLATFHVQFCRAESHGDVVLDFFSSFLRDTHAQFDVLAADLIITSALDFVTGLVLEHRTKDVKLAPAAKHFPKFARGLSGATHAYSFCMFPPEVPVDSYIQTLPELEAFLNGANDVLSFYKEELAGDERNWVSITARCLGLRKIDVLRDLAKEVIENDKNVRLLLESDGVALKAYDAFAERYVAFHRSLPRYRLDELKEIDLGATS